MTGAFVWCDVESIVVTRLLFARNAGDGDGSAGDQQDSDEESDDASGVPNWLKKLIPASSDGREEQTDRVASQYFQDIFDEEGNVREELLYHETLDDAVESAVCPWLGGMPLARWRGGCWCVRSS